MNATSNSIKLMAATNGTDTAATASDLKMKIKQTKLNTRM